LLFDFQAHGRMHRCELIDHDPYGVEAQFTQPERDYLYADSIPSLISIGRRGTWRAVGRWKERKVMER